MSLQRGSRQAQRRLSSAIFEPLEQRKLLTTVLAGQTFEFVQITDSGSVIVRVAVNDPSGKGQVDLIGATLIPDGAGGQTAILNQIPGIINDDGVDSDRFGGLGGADGVEPIDVITGAPNSLTNVDYSAIGGPALDAAQGAIHYDAMSSDTTGRTYALTLEEFNDENAVALINVDYTVSGAGVALQDLAGAIVGLTGAEGTDDIQSVVAADFLPSDDTKLYFVVVVAVDRPSLDSDDPVSTDVPFLFYYDFAAPDPASAVVLVDSFQSDPGAPVAERIPDVFGFTFDDDDNLIAYVTARSGSVQAGEVVTEEENGLVVLDRTSPVFGFDQLITVTVDNDPVDIYGLEFVAGDTGFIYAIEGDDTDSRLLHVDYVGPGAGIGIDFGPLPDPDDIAGATRGEALSDLVWNPRYLNTFRINDDNPNNDSKRGALIAQDTVTDELVFVDTAQRFPVTNLYALHFTNGSPNMTVSIATVPARNVTNRPMQPFTGDAGSIRHPNAQDGELIVSGIPTGTGGVQIGAKTRDFYDDPINNEDLLPIRRIRKTPNQNFGNFPSNAKYVYSGISGVGDIGNLLVGGTVLGRVAIEGSVAGNLYAGVWATGDPGGRLQAADYSDVAGNFYVAGDARNILSLTSFGSVNAAGNEPTYLTGSDIVVGGKAGQVRALNSFYGNITANNSFKGLNQAIREIEDRRGTPSGSASYFEGFSGGTGSLGGNESFFNDTLATAQFIGTHFSSAYRSDEVAIINGRLNNSPQVEDGVDYYAMALLAGQTITVQLDSRFAPMSVGVFDADDRLIATDRSDLGIGVVAGKPFQVKIDRPGVYKFAVARQDDITFSGTSSLLAVSPYTLRITNAADASLGALVAGGDIYSYDIFTPRAGVRTLEGDVGLVQAANIFDDTSESYTLDKGNLRAVIAGNIGLTGVIDAGIELFVPRGDVGLIRNTGAIMRINELLPFVDTFTGLPDPTLAVGRDIQWIDSTGTFSGSLSANRAIGNIHADTFTNQATDAPYIIVNADRTGNDGIVEIADITGSFEGPQIYTGPGGNFRYLRVTGTIFAPSQFGTPQELIPTTYDPGDTARYVDDSGADVKLTPTPLVRDFSFPGTGELVNPGQLTVWAYPVADSDKNGVILARVQLDQPGGPNLVNHGLLVEAGTQGAGGSVEIGEIFTFNEGRVIAEAAAVLGAQPSLSLPDRRLGEGLTFPPDGLSPVDLVFKGSAPVDVWYIEARRKLPVPTPPLATLDSIENSTGGEIVNVLAASVGDISAETIGLTKSHVGANRSNSGLAVMGNEVLDFDVEFGGAGATPMVQPRTGIVIHQTSNGDPAYLISARARQGLGNIFVQGIIGSVVPNSNGKGVKGVHEGINAPVVAIPTTNGANITDARIISINLGEGLLPSGTGEVPFSGIFAGDHIGSITNQGVGSDIRNSDIMAGYLPFFGTGVVGPDAFKIASIRLDNGAIINSDIRIVDDLVRWQESIGLTSQPLLPEVGDTTTTPSFDIEQLVIKGNGGIIGTNIDANDIGPIVIDGGFGFINSFMGGVTNSVHAGVDTTGYGIRDSQIYGGTRINNVIARGTGKRIATTSFTPSVRQSQGKEGFDPYSGQLYSEMNDLHRYLGTTEKTPKLKGISNDGVIEDTQIAATEQLNTLSAHRITGRQRTTRVQFGNLINNVNVADSVDNLQLSTGRLRNFRTGADVSYSQIGVAGQAENVYVGGTFRGTSRLTVTGPQGRLLKMQTKRALFGTVNVVNNIGSLRVGTDMGSSSLRGLANIDTLNVAGSVLTGGRADFRNGTITNLTVGGDIQSDGIVRAKSVVNQSIGGEIFGDIIIG